MTGYLVLEDGEIFEGQWQGDKTWTGVGEVVFNTSLMGYQEILTDPSYYQQIIVMTTPEQGNYGVSDDERESKKIWAQGFVCVELNDCSDPKRKTLRSELAEFSRPALSDIDTRTLTLHLRSRGTPWGAMLVAKDADSAKKQGMTLISERKSKVNSDWVYEVSSQKTEIFKGQGKKGRIALIDYGTKINIISELQKRFSEVAVFNSRAKVADILSWEPSGIMLTNGPGDPAAVKESVDVVKQLLGQKPIFGICMGHQILSLALGGKTFKLKFGHRGGNHPVRNLKTGEVYMTSQNHGYAVSEDLPSGVKVSQINLYDKTVEGIESEKMKAWSVQYHPESAPGPHDANVLFDHFHRDVTP